MTTNAIKYLRGIKNSINNDVKTIALYHSNRDNKKSAGYFSTPREVFCYVDHLGYLAYGSLESTKRSLRFIKDYFPHEYGKYAELIYSMWRHGTVHEYAPSSFFRKNNGQAVKISWLSNNLNAKRFRRAHLKIYRLERDNNNLRIVINTCQLVDDLISAVDQLISETQKDSRFSLHCGRRIDIVRKYRNCMTIRKCSKKIREALYNQIILAQKNSQGDINKFCETI